MVNTCIHRILVHILVCRAIALKMPKNSHTEFILQIWKTFFHCAISFLTQGPLQLQNFSSNKRSKIVARYKDMRRETGFEIRSMWFNLGQHKLDFIPDIVGPVLEMTLIPETGGLFHINLSHFERKRYVM